MADAPQGLSARLRVHEHHGCRPIWVAFGLALSRPLTMNAQAGSPGPLAILLSKAEPAVGLLKSLSWSSELSVQTSYSLIMAQLAFT